MSFKLSYEGLDQAAISEALDRLFRRTIMPAQTVDVTRNGITSKVRASSLVEPAATPSPQPAQEPPMTDVEIRIWCVEQAVKRGGDPLADITKDAQNIYDWVTRASKADSPAVVAPATP